MIRLSRRQSIEWCGRSARFLYRIHLGDDQGRKLKLQGSLLVAVVPVGEEPVHVGLTEALWLKCLVPRHKLSANAVRVVFRHKQASRAYVHHLEVFQIAPAPRQPAVLSWVWNRGIQD